MSTCRIAARPIGAASVERNSPRRSGKNFTKCRWAPPPNFEPTSATHPDTCLTVSTLGYEKSDDEIPAAAVK